MGEGSCTGRGREKGPSLGYYFRGKRVAENGFRGAATFAERGEENGFRGTGATFAERGGAENGFGGTTTFTKRGEEKGFRSSERRITKCVAEIILVAAKIPPCGIRHVYVVKWCERVCVEHCCHRRKNCSC